jgi:thiamine biosynthesis protein ThiS
VIAGHIFSTASKPGIAPRGTSWLADVVRACPAPVIAIGGVTAENTAQVIEAGASGIAVIGALTAADDPREAAIRLRATIDNAWSRRQMQEQTSTIEIILNGKSASVATGCTILDLLGEKELGERLVVVELNGAIVPRSDFGERVFSAGDKVEIVHFVGGGA